MIRSGTTIALIAALTLLPITAIALPAPAKTFTPLLPTKDKISVSTESSNKVGSAEIQAYCAIVGGSLFIDRNYAGTLPYAGSLPPGSHYIELQLAGYDPLGIWLTLEKKTKYVISFNPDQTIALFPNNQRVQINTQPTLDASTSAFEIFCDIGGGELYIDKNDLGSLPSGNIPYEGSIAAGSHYFEAVFAGYRTLGFWLLLEQRTKYTITLVPERITGSLSIDVEPADASVSIDETALDASAGKGTFEVPVGPHKLRIWCFGYVEQSIDVTVTEKATYYVKLSLAKAPFSVTGLGFDRPVFNPRNAGAPGKTRLVFNASNYGSAIAEIRGQAGERGAEGTLVATLEFPTIDTWDQSRTWNGRSADGTPLPDGIYSVALTAKPGPGVPTRPDAGQDGAVTLRTEVRIDSSLVIRSFGTASAVPGLLFMPDPLVQPAGTFATEASWFVPWGEPQSSAIGLSTAYSFSGVASIAAHAAIETGSSAECDLALSALVALFGDRASLVCGSVFIRGGYSSSPTPSMPGAGSTVEASVPVSIRLGEFSFALSPGGFLNFSSSPPAFLGLARTGLWLEGRSFKAGASGELPIAFSGAGPVVQWPARAALEGRLMLGSTPFVAACYLDAELQPETSPTFGIGLGLGLLF